LCGTNTRFAATDGPVGGVVLQGGRCAPFLDQISQNLVEDKEPQANSFATWPSEVP